MIQSDTQSDTNISTFTLTNIVQNAAVEIALENLATGEPPQEGMKKDKLKEERSQRVAEKSRQQYNIRKFQHFRNSWIIRKGCIIHNRSSVRPVSNFLGKLFFKKFAAQPVSDVSRVHDSIITQCSG